MAAAAFDSAAEAEISASRRRGPSPASPSEGRRWPPSSQEPPRVRQASWLGELPVCEESRGARSGWPLHQGCGLDSVQDHCVAPILAPWGAGTDFPILKLVSNRMDCRLRDGQARLLDGLAHGRVGVDRAAQVLGAAAILHVSDDLRSQFPCAAADDLRAEDPVAVASAMIFTNPSVESLAIARPFAAKLNRPTFTGI